jgi:hypothetical protein
MLIDPLDREGGDELPIAYAPGPDPSRFLPPSRVAISVPEDYPLPGGSARIRLGEVEAVTMDGDAASGVSSGAYLEGPILTGDPSGYAPDSPASTCDPRPHSQVWEAKLSAFRLVLDIPVFVDPPSRSGESAELVLCSPVPSVNGKPVGPAPIQIEALIFRLPIPPLQGRATYSWSAQVTPLGSDLTTPSPSDTFEIRALLPSRLTLTGPKVAQTYHVTLHGRLTVGGRPMAGVPVSVWSTNPNDGGIGGSAKTGKNGRFSVSVPITRTTSYLASAYGPLVVRCSASSAAPAGCLSTTITGPPDAIWKVRV